MASRAFARASGSDGVGATSTGLGFAVFAAVLCCGLAWAGCSGSGEGCATVAGATFAGGVGWGAGATTGGGGGVTTGAGAGVGTGVGGTTVAGVGVIWPGGMGRAEGCATGAGAGAGCFFVWVLAGVGAGCGVAAGGWFCNSFIRCRTASRTFSSESG